VLPRVVGYPAAMVFSAFTPNIVGGGWMPANELASCGAYLVRPTATQCARTATGAAAAAFPCQDTNLRRRGARRAARGARRAVCALPARARAPAQVERAHSPPWPVPAVRPGPAAALQRLTPRPTTSAQVYEGGFGCIRAPDEHGGGYTLYARQFHAKDSIVVLGPPNNNNEPVVCSPAKYVARGLIPYDAVLDMGPNDWYNANPNVVFNWGNRGAMTPDCGNEPPNQFHPPWYFLNHAPTRTGQCDPRDVRANLKIKLEWIIGTEIVEGQPVVKKKRMPVFVATEDIQTGKPLAFSYAEHPWAWCKASHCLGCKCPVVEDLECDESLDGFLDGLLGVGDLLGVDGTPDAFDTPRQSPAAVTEAPVVDPAEAPVVDPDEEYEGFADGVFADGVFDYQA